MPFLSCADQSRHQEDHLIGTAPTSEWFVMIECPPPWGNTIQDAKFLPLAWRQVITSSLYKELGIRFFLVGNEQTIEKHRAMNSAESP